MRLAWPRGRKEKWKMKQPRPGSLCVGCWASVKSERSVQQVRRADGERFASNAWLIILSIYHVETSQSEIMTSNLCLSYVLRGCFSCLISYLTLGQLLLCSQLRARDLVGKCENFRTTTHWIHGKTGEPSLENEQKPRAGGWSRADVIPLAGAAALAASHPERWRHPCSPCLRKDGSGSASWLTCCRAHTPRQQGLFSKSRCLISLASVVGRSARGTKTKQTKRTDIPEISIDGEFSVRRFSVIFVSFVFLFHLDGKFVVFLLRKMEPGLYML